MAKTYRRARNGKTRRIGDNDVRARSLHVAINDGSTVAYGKTTCAPKYAKKARNRQERRLGQKIARGHF